MEGSPASGTSGTSSYRASMTLAAKPLSPGQSLPSRPSLGSTVLTRRDTMLSSRPNRSQVKVSLSTPKEAAALGPSQEPRERGSSRGPRSHSPPCGQGLASLAPSLSSGVLFSHCESVRSSDASPGSGHLTDAQQPGAHTVHRLEPVRKREESRAGGALGVSVRTAAQGPRAMLLELVFPVLLFPTERTKVVSSRHALSRSYSLFERLISKCCG